MTGYLCATPYHIMAATTLASGLCSEDKNILVILDHFSVSDDFAEKIEKCNLFDKVIIYKSNKKTKLNNVKRLVNAFFPPKIMKDLSKFDFDRFFCLALDFIDITYLMKKLEKRGKKCEFAFADDGLGSYLNDNIYNPKRVSEIILKLNGRISYLDKIEKMYVYKPEYVVANKRFVTEKIPQTEKTTAALKNLANAVWKLDIDVDIDGKTLYFEQPYEAGKDFTAREQEFITNIKNTLAVESAIKMHPRSFGDENWKAFDVIESKMPIEAMLMQMDCTPLVMMTNYSTASFATYLFDNLGASDCPTILTFKCIENQDLQLGALIEKFIDKVNKTLPKKSIYLPEDEKELIRIVESIKNTMA